MYLQHSDHSRYDSTDLFRIIANFIKLYLSKWRGITGTIAKAITRVIWQKQMGLTEITQMSEHYLLRMQIGAN